MPGGITWSIMVRFHDGPGFTLNLCPRLSSSAKVCDLFRALPYLVFACWVSICAAVPEVLWRGLTVLIKHFSASDVYAIILIGLMATVFVEPLMERAKQGRWFIADDGGGRHPLLTVMIALSSGVIAVGVHECLTAFLEAAEEAQKSDVGGIGQGFGLLMRWAILPMVVTLAWFAGRLPKPWPVVVGAGACLWAVVVGYLLQWSFIHTAKNLVACLLLVPAGQIYLTRHWGQPVLHRLALALLLAIPPWLGLVTVAEWAWHYYGFAASPLAARNHLGVDLRVYLGCAFGIALAPAPWSHHSR